RAQSVEWTRVDQPSARVDHAMAYDSARGATVLFGGEGGVGEGSDDETTWEWNGTVWARGAINGPSRGGAMAYDTTRGVTVLFKQCAQDPNCSDGETWEWDGSVWTQRVVSGPSSRIGHAMAYDAARGVTVLFGGYSIANHVANDETWEWDG